MVQTSHWKFKNKISFNFIENLEPHVEKLTEIKEKNESTLLNISAFANVE